MTEYEVTDIISYIFADSLQTATEAMITLFFADVDADMDFFHNLHCF